MTVYEPRVEILRAALESRDLSSVVAGARIASSRDDLPKPEGGGPLAILRHTPSIRLDPSAFESAARRLETLHAVARGLRIAVVGPFYGGSLPVAGYCASALRNLGHEVGIRRQRCVRRDVSVDRRITESAPHRDILRA